MLQTGFESDHLALCRACSHYVWSRRHLKGSGDSRRPHGAPLQLILTTSMRQIVVSTSLGWETMTSDVVNTFTSASSFCSVTEGGLGTWILMVSGRDSGYC